MCWLIVCSNASFWGGTGHKHTHGDWLFLLVLFWSLQADVKDLNSGHDRFLEKSVNKPQITRPHYRQNYVKCHCVVLNMRWWSALCRDFSAGSCKSRSAGARSTQCEVVQRADPMVCPYCRMSCRPVSMQGNFWRLHSGKLLECIVSYLRLVPRLHINDPRATEFPFFLDVLLTVHLSLILVIDQLNAQILVL